MTEKLAALADLRTRVVRAIDPEVVGQRPAVDLLLVAHFAGGHALLEGVPGVGKTSLVRSFAEALGYAFGRIQLTADLMPSDLLGSHVYDPERRRFELVRGPIFRDFVLADELNRAPPRTQGALLEAMQERRVTLDGDTLPLPEHFTLFATQNPSDHEGTYPLPAAELDRFMIKLTLGYPSADDEDTMLARAGYARPPRPAQLARVSSPEELILLRDAAEHVFVSEPVRRFVRDLVRATREHAAIRLGASPRAALHLLCAARWAAAFAGAAFVTPDHVLALCDAVLAHRLVLSADAELDGLDAHGVLGTVLRSVEVPR
jgi:MoxR-like ATPase